MPVWYIMDEFGARVQHSADAPNVRMVPFISTIDGAAYSLLFPVQNVDEGEEISRDGCQMAIASFLACMCLALRARRTALRCKI